MRVEQSHWWGGLVSVLELLDPGLKTSYVLAHELRPCLALAIVVLAAFCLLCAYTLLTGGLRAVAFLYVRRMLALVQNEICNNARTIFRFLQRKHALPRTENR